MVQITDLGNSHIYRTEQPNLVYDIGLTPNELSIYCHLKRIAGDGGACFMSRKKLAEKCCMSLSCLIRTKKSLSQPRKELGGLPLITITERTTKEGDRDTDLIQIVDIWLENMTLFSKGKREGFQNLIRGGVAETPGVVSQKHQGGVTETPKEEPIKNINKINDNKALLKCSQLSKKEVKKESLPLSQEKKKNNKPADNPKEFLTKEQQRYFDVLSRFTPEIGDKLDSSAISYWIKTFGIERTKEAVRVYWEQVEKSRLDHNVPMPQKAGAYIRNVLNNETIKPMDENFLENKKFAQELSKKEECIEVLEKYVKIANGFFKDEMYYSAPQDIFKRWMHEKICNSGCGC